MSGIIDFITKNYGTIIYDFIMCIVGIVIGILVTPKEKSDNRSNNTPINQIVIHIQEIIISSKYEEENEKNTKRDKANDASSDNSFMLLIGLGLTFLFVEYHSVIIKAIVGITLLILSSTITIALKLHKKNNLDKLNKLWITLSLIIVATNITVIILMNRQALSLNDINGILNAVYFALGLVYIILPNLFSIALNIHMYALNSYLSKSNKVALWILTKTKRFVLKPKTSFVSAIVMCIIALLLSSGLALQGVMAMSKFQFESIETLGQ